MGEAIRWRFVCACFVVACGAPAPDDGGIDSTAACSDAVCDDGLFCNGVERCDPSDPAADAIGCVGSSLDPCVGETCVEASDTCVAAGCDEDGDGVDSVACGGADCDDADPDRFPGNRERCMGRLRDDAPAADHDEDCDPCTVVGASPDGDADADLYPAARCSNPWLDATMPIGCDPTRTRSDDVAMTTYGADCNDDPDAGGADVRPNQTEICANAIDDNCDGRVDESCSCDPGDPPRDCGPTVPPAGICRMGRQSCGADGFWGECLGIVEPAVAEICDPADPLADEDCDGLVNEDGSGTENALECASLFPVMENCTVCAGSPHASLIADDGRLTCAGGICDARRCVAKPSHVLLTRVVLSPWSTCGSLRGTEGTDCAAPFGGECLCGFAEWPLAPSSPPAPDGDDYVLEGTIWNTHATSPCVFQLRDAAGDVLASGAIPVGGMPFFSYVFDPDGPASGPCVLSPRFHFFVVSGSCYFQGFQLRRT